MKKEDIKVGMKVRIRDEVPPESKWRTGEWEDIVFIGKEATVDSVYGTWVSVTFDDDESWSYPFSWIEPVEEIEVKPNNRTPRKHAELIKKWADDKDMVIEFRTSASEAWTTAHNPQWYDSTEYREAPKPEPIPEPTYHYLIKNKGKFAVTSQKFANEDGVHKFYKNPVVVVQRLDE